MPTGSDIAGRQRTVTDDRQRALHYPTSDDLSPAEQLATSFIACRIRFHLSVEKRFNFSEQRGESFQLSSHSLRVQTGESLSEEK